MTFSKLTSRFRLPPAARNGRLCGSPVTDSSVPARTSDWRDAARNLASRLMPVMVLVAAAVLGLAAVAMA